MPIPQATPVNEKYPDTSSVRVILCLDSAGINQFLTEFLGVLQIVILMFFLGFVEGGERLNADVDVLAGFGFQCADSGFSGLLLQLGAIIDSKRIGVTAVDKLAVRVEGVDTTEENLQKALERYFSRIKIDSKTPDSPNLLSNCALPLYNRFL